MEPISVQKDQLNRKLLRVIIVEDSAVDAALVERQLTRTGCEVTAVRVESAAAFAEALATGDWDVIIADYTIPGFGAVPALNLLRQSGRDIPFIIVSGAITDEIAVASMRAGAHDYVLKDNIARLVPAIEREIREALARRQKRQAEETVRYLSAIVESSDAAIIGKTLDGTVTSWNRGAEQLYAYSAAEMLGRSISVLIPPDRPNELPGLMQRLAGGEHIEQYEAVRRRKDGSLVSVSVKISPIVDAASNIIGASMIAHDITQRKCAEEALRESERRFRALAENIPQMIAVLDAEGNFQYLSPKWLGYTGTTLEQNANGGWANAIHPDDRPRAVEAWNAAVATRGTFEVEYRLRRHDVEYRWHLGRAVPIQNPNTNTDLWFGSNTDIEDQKRGQQALMRSEKLASVGRMAATIAHEINNPLASAMNALFLASLNPSLDDAARKNLELAETELERVAHLTKQTLGFYRETGTPTGVEVAEIVNGVLDIYGPKLKNKSVAVQRRFRSTARIQAIEGELRQVFSNLVANSIDAVNWNGVLHVRTSGPHSSDGKRSMVRLTVADTGSGISSEDMKRVFEPFFTTKEAVGTGLGLWVTSELVKKHGGRIRVRSRLGKGTVFSMWWPAERRQREREAVPGAMT